MSLVNHKMLDSIQESFSDADSADTWEKGYRIAMQGLSAALAALRQIDSITSGVTVTIKMEDRL